MISDQRILSGKVQRLFLFPLRGAFPDWRDRPDDRVMAGTSQ